MRSRILIVDDEPANLKLLETMLVQRGYEVVQAENGKNALERILEQRIDLILSDVMMPEMNGFEMCRGIKRHEKYRNIPVVLITALTAKEDRIKGIEAGAEDFLSKPFDQAEVLARIRMLLEMRGLHQRLDSAYVNLNHLLSFGEKIAETFDPLKFNFLSGMNSMVYQVIRLKEDMVEKPGSVFVGILVEGGRWQCYRYEFVSEKLRRSLLKLDLQDCLDLSKYALRIAFYNERDLENPEIEPLIRKLGSKSIKVSNLVGYLSGELCILFMNYGREVTSYDASVLRALVIQSLFLKSLSAQIKETEQAFAYTIRALARAAEAHDEDAGNHITQVGEYSGLIAEKMGLPETFVKAIRLQAQMHDVGKINIPMRILEKTHMLNSEEWARCKSIPCTARRYWEIMRD